MDSPSLNLPPLRQDLKISQTYDGHDGEAQYLLYDPLKHAYHSLNKHSFTLLNNWQAGAPEPVLEKASQQADQPYELEDIETLISFMFRHSLADTPRNGDSKSFFDTHEEKQKHSAKRLMHSYVFFRIPILKPQKLLNRLAPFINIFFSNGFWLFMALSTLLSLGLIAREWDEFISTFFGFLSVEGLIGYGLAIILTKTAHEFGHAFAAHRYGCRVTSLGIGFMLLFPLLYADTTDAWKIKSRQKRLVIGAAGMGAELIIAVFATLLWAILPDGSLRAITFFLASSSWIFTLIINLNPLMRFDGYYLLSDFLNFKNLQPRSNALGIWWLREQLFAPGDPCPENLPANLSKGLIFYAFCVWIYRFFLFLGIALLLHAFIIKIIAHLLAAIEIGWFIVKPVLMEIKNWPDLMRRGRHKNNFITASFIAAAFLLLLVPWRSTVRAPAVIEPAIEQSIFAGLPGQIEQINVTHGQKVKKGDTLVVLSSPALTTQKILTRQTIALLQARINRQSVDAIDRSQRHVLLSELANEKERLSGFEKLQQDMIIRAPFDGEVHGLAHGLHPKRWVNTSLPLLEVRGSAPALTTAYVVEDDFTRIAVGASSKFIAEDPLMGKKLMRVRSISPAGTLILDKPILSSTYGGSVAARENKQGEIEPVRGMFKILLDGSTKIDREVPGVVLIKGEARSIASSLWRRIIAIYNRETVN